MSGWKEKRPSEGGRNSTRSWDLKKRQTLSKAKETGTTAASDNAKKIVKPWGRRWKSHGPLGRGGAVEFGGTGKEGN